jgi:hypothetical protein
MKTIEIKRKRRDRKAYDARQRAIIARVIEQLAEIITPHVNPSVPEELLQDQIKGYIQAHH